MAEDGRNLALVVGTWMDAVRTGTMDHLASILADDVVWHGFVPGAVCHGRDEVMATMGRGRDEPPRVTRLEALEIGEAVVMCVEGPDFRHPATGERRPAAFMRLTLHDGRVTEMRGTATRDEALRA